LRITPILAEVGVANLGEERKANTFRVEPEHRNWLKSVKCPELQSGEGLGAKRRRSLI